MSFNIKNKNSLLKFLSILLLIPIFALLYKIYIPRSTAFGCFDDCFNIVGGFFLQNGKHIYSDFFYNHQPFPAFISLIIQNVTKPTNIFELILRHHQFILMFGFVFYILLILRFGLKAFIFAILFEFSKFYFFGDRFLAESYIVYPLIYILGIAILRLKDKKIYSFDIFLSAIFCWFIAFSREPYVPIAIFLFLIIIYKQARLKKESLVALVIFIILSLITLAFFNLKDYFFNTLTVNFQVVLPRELSQQIYGGPLQMFFYPFYIFVEGPLNLLKFYLVGFDILFLFLLFRLFKNKHYKFIVFLIFTFFLSNLRPNVPAKPFYESFHMLIWFSFFIFITVYLVFEQKKQVFYLAAIYLTGLFSIFVFSPSNFIYDKINQQEQLITNFGTTMQEGEVIKALSLPKDTLFLDGSDDLVYWQAKKLSFYKYTWYTSVMPYFSIYKNARKEMFDKTPPEFYRGLGDCRSINLDSDSRFIEKNYARLLVDDKPSCLFIKKDKLKDITVKQEEKLAQLHYFLPKK